jgi:cbb3-type cytochrome oxidase maturation protein
MEILFVLIPLAIVLMIVAVVFFLWTVKSGQYDDLEGPAHRILMDDDDPLIPRYGQDDNKKGDQTTKES